MNRLRVVLLTALVLCALLPAVASEGTYHVSGRVLTAVPEEEAVVDLLATVPLAAIEIVRRDGDVAVAQIGMVRIELIDSNGKILAITLAQTSGYRLSFSDTPTGPLTYVVYDAATNVKLDELTHEAPDEGPDVSLNSGLEGNRRYLLIRSQGSEVGTELPHPKGAGQYKFTRIGQIDVMHDIRGGGFAYGDRPFGGTLELFGAASEEFYRPGVGEYCYRILAGVEALSDPLHKVRYVVEKKDGLLDISSERERLGPFTAGSYENCYRFTPAYGLRQGRQFVFWSQPDLLVRWNTAGRNDTYNLMMQVFKRGPTDWDQVGVLPLISLNVHVHNEKVKSSLGLQLERLDDTTGPPDDCSIINLSGMDSVAVEFRADHEHLAGYSITATSNCKGSDPILLSPGDSATNGEILRPLSSNDFDGPCVYTFRLTAAAKTTDGYRAVYRASRSMAFYVNP